MARFDTSRSPGTPGPPGELGADRVLDVGCGTGCLAILLAGTGRAVVALDPGRGEYRGG